MLIIISDNLEKIKAKQNFVSVLSVRYTSLVISCITDAYNDTNGRK